MTHTKHIILGALMVLLCGKVNAQQITNYTFTSGLGSYTPITNATVPALTGGDLDEGWYANIPLGFEFWYMGTLVNNIQASTNGVLSLSQTSLPNGAAPNNTFSGNPGAFYRPLVAPLWDNLDMDTLSGAEFSYVTTGTAPYRVFTAQWKNAEWNWFANDAAISFQAKFYETTGVIEFIYKQEVANLFSPSASIGISGSINTSYLSLNGTGSSPSLSSSVSYNTLNSKPATGQSYIFTPPTPSNVSSLSITNINPTSLTVNWSPVTGAVKYAVYKSIDNTNYTYAGNSSSTSLIVGGLFPNTTYYFQVYAISEGAYSSNPASGNATTQSGAISGVISVPGAAPSITSVLDSIKNYGIGGAVIIELQNGYNPSLERFPIYISDTLGTSAAAPLTIRPASGASGIEIYPTSSYTNTFLFTSAKSVTIDGRPGGVGVISELTIRTSNYSAGIYFNANYGTSTNCNVTYLKMKAAPSATYINAYIEMYGYVQSSLTNNIISNCELGDSNVMATYGIRMYTYNNFVASDNSIINNKIFNIGGGASTSVGIYIYGTNNNKVNIIGNHIYNFSPINASYTSYYFYGIYLQGGSHNVKYNYIGGTDTACTGNTFEIGPASTASNFYGIYYYGTTNQTINVQGNKIANFFWPGSSTTPWTGIYIQGGNAFIGDTVSNIIGDPTSGTPSVYVLSQLNTSTPVACGIKSIGNGVVKIKNNLISGISAVGVNSSYPCSVTGILGTTSTNMEISGNTVGNTNFTNALRAASPNSTYAQSAIGIQVNGTGLGNLSVTDNIVSNVVNSGTSTSLQNITSGIHITSNSSAIVSGNQINNIYSSSGNPSSNGSTAVTGLYYNTTSGAANLSGNVIHTLRTLSTTAPVHVLGINVISSSGSAINVNANFVHSFKTNSTALASGLTGIYLQDGIINATNNMVRLGIDNTGTSVTTGNIIIGINKITSYDANIYHNTVYIGGTVTGTSLVNTYAFKKSNDGLDEVKNNIFTNLRTNATSGGKHYAMGLNTANNIVSNYNLLLASGNNGRLFQLGSTDYNNRVSWFVTTSLDEYSDSANIPFLNATGNAASVDLHVSAITPTKVEGNGGVTFVTTDFDGQIRSTLGPVDIGADAGVFVKQNIIPVPVSWVWVKAVQAQSNAIIKWQVASQLNNSKFIIQRSVDGKYFIEVGELEGAGTLNAIATYSYTDVGVFARNFGTVYYRVIQIDYSGASSQSQTVAIENANQLDKEVNVWPNPVTDFLNLDLPVIPLAQKVQLEVVNYLGVNCLKQEVYYANKLKLSVKDLEPGVYFIKVKIDEESESVRKIVIAE
jgi:hypothetical protein